MEIDSTLVRRLVASQFPQWAELPLEPVRSFGTDNAIYRLGAELVVRLPRRGTNALQLAKERRWLTTLAPLMPLAIPVPLAIGEPADRYPFEWAIYRWLEGEVAAEAPIADPGHAAARLARFIAALQRVDPTDGPMPGEHNSFRGVPLRTQDEATRAAIAALSATVDARAATAAWEAALGAPEWSGPPVWIHGDLDSRNLLVHDGRLSGVIDFGCLGIGDPACDVAVAWKVLSADTRDSFRAALSVDDATWARSRGWALCHGLNAVSYYTLETNRQLVLEGQRWIAEALTD